MDRTIASSATFSLYIRMMYTVLWHVPLRTTACLGLRIQWGKSLSMLVCSHESFFPCCWFRSVALNRMAVSQSPPPSPLWCLPLHRLSPPKSLTPPCDDAKLEEEKKTSFSPPRSEQSLELRKIKTRIRNPRVVAILSWSSRPEYLTSANRFSS